MEKNQAAGHPVPILDLPAQHRDLKEPILRALGELLDSGAFVLGAAVERFEEEAAAYLGVKHAIGVASGTDALDLTLRAAGVRPGDEVITPAYSFFAIAEAIDRVGAVPVLVDIDGVTFNVSAEGVAAAITEKTRAVVPVHLYGLPAPVAAIREATRGREIAIVEDAAQAFGAEADGVKAGALGDGAAFSFYPTKNLGACGDGGLVTTSRDDVARLVRRLRDHGQTGRYEHSSFGWNSRLDAMQAAILSIKLPLLDGWNDRRRALANLYREALADSTARLPFEPAGSKHVYHQFAIRVAGRNELQGRLGERRIATSIHYPAGIHQQPVFAGRFGAFPEAERAAREVLCLPIHPELTDDDARRVAFEVGEGLGKAAGRGGSKG
ncbi:MAG: DegT/DnrJ/EryC1/StrS family aminotransferase [Candidatus Eisenbacteria bacterium]